MAITVARAIELIVDWTHEEILALERHLGFHPNRKPPEIVTVADAHAVAALQPAPEVICVDVGSPPVTILPFTSQEQPVVQEIKTEIPEPEGSPVIGDDAETPNHAEPSESPAPAAVGDSGEQQHGSSDEGPEVGQ